MIDKDRSIGFLSGAIHRGAHRYFEKELAVLQLHRGMVHILKRLYEKDGLSQRDLSTNLLMDKSNITRIITRMEEMNLIMRNTDPEDARSKIINLTDKAWELQPSLHKVFSGWSEILTKDMKEDEIEMLRFLLRKCITNMNSYFENKESENGST